MVFTQRLNGVTGGVEWVEQEETYDYHQEIARAGFADMLHDSERNRKYHDALKEAIQTMHTRGKKAHVLDIGTGTGLLSMMAVRCGADSVVACEAFPPMAQCAQQILQDNGCDGEITLIHKRSTEIVVGEDMPHRANILVTEVFDTELIGEGALETFRHAHKELLESDCIVVPHSATLWAQIVECPPLYRWNALIDVADEEGDILLKTPTEIKQCPGSASVHDIQMSCVPPHSVKQLTAPLPVLHFPWGGQRPLPLHRIEAHHTTVLHTGTPQMVFMWWELSMDTQGKIVLSCAPWWHHPDTDLKSPLPPQATIPWRDHWMQAVYYLPPHQQAPLSQGGQVTLLSSHDAYSLWFTLGGPGETTAPPRPVCTCGAHMAYSRTHVAYMNDSHRNKKMLRVLREKVNKDTVLLCLNGNSMLGLAACAMGAKKVLYIEGGPLSKRVLQSYIQHNQLEGRVVVYRDLREVLRDHPLVTLVLSDPCYAGALLPWDHLRSLAPLLTPSPPNTTLEVIPSSCSLWAMPVQFRDLHKIKAPLGVCEGIDLKLFDKLLQESRAISDSEIEPHPLWEYPCVARSLPHKVLQLDLLHAKDVVCSEGSVPLDVETTYNGFAFWMEWDLDGGARNRVSSGPVSPPQEGEVVQWDPHTRQGVHILEQSKEIKRGDHLHHKVKCDLSTGNIHIDVHIQ